MGPRTDRDSRRPPHNRPQGQPLHCHLSRRYPNRAGGQHSDLGLGYLVEIGCHAEKLGAGFPDGFAPAAFHGQVDGIGRRAQAIVRRYFQVTEFVALQELRTECSVARKTVRKHRCQRLTHTSARFQSSPNLKKLTPHLTKPRIGAYIVLARLQLRSREVFDARLHSS